MKPLPGRPPIHSMSTRGSDNGGGFGSSSRDAGSVEAGRTGFSSSTSPRRRAAGESTAGPTSGGLKGTNPTWMRKLEEKYQKLHHKIANIPTYNSNASRFSFFARRVNKERLAKLANNSNDNNNNDNDNNPDVPVNATEDTPTTTTNVNTSTTDNNNIDVNQCGDGDLEKDARRKNSSMSSTNAPKSYYKHSLETEYLTTHSAHRRLHDENHHYHYYGDNDDLNDENFPATKEGFVTRPTTVLNGARLANSGGSGSKGEDLDCYSIDDPFAHPRPRFCQLHRASCTNLSQLSGKGSSGVDGGGGEGGGLTLHSVGDSGSGSSGGGGGLPPPPSHCCACRGCNVADTVCGAEKALSRSSSLSVGPPERDAATGELNAGTMAAVVVADLAVGPKALSGLAHNNISRPSVNGRQRSDHCDCGVRGAGTGVGVSGYEADADVCAEGRATCTCDDALRHGAGHSVSTTGGVGGMVAGGDGRRVFVEVSGGGVIRRSVRRGGGGEASPSGSDEMMGEASARGIRTLDPIANGSRGGGNKLRTAKTGASYYSSSTTKSCPAAFRSNELPVPSARRVRSRPQQQHQQQPQQEQNGQNGERKDMRVFAQMSMEARHAVTETLKEMGEAAVDKQRQQLQQQQQEMKENGEGGEGMEGEERAGEAGKGEDEDGDDDGNNKADNCTISVYSNSAANHSALQQQQQQKQQHQNPTRRSKQRRHARRPLSTHPSREDSSTSYKTSTRQTSWRTARNVDATSSVNATVKGGTGRSPRRSYNSNRKPPSTIQNSSNNPRLRPRSERTLETNTYAEFHSNDAEPDGVDFDLLSMVSVSVESNLSSPEVRHDPPKRMHLPAITTSRTDPTDSLHPGMRNANIRHVNYRIQGVGSYRVARETTFEITAPDFDIRYRDVITCQRGDRDTPPPEIFEKSVGKVKDWLNKYCAS